MFKSPEPKEIPDKPATNNEGATLKEKEITGEKISEEEVLKLVELVSHHNGADVVEISKDANFDRFIIGVLAYDVAFNEYELEYVRNHPEKFTDDIHTNTHLQSIDRYKTNMDLWLRLAKGGDLVEALRETNETARYNWSHYAGTWGGTGGGSFDSQFKRSKKSEEESQKISVIDGFNYELEEQMNSRIDRAGGKEKELERIRIMRDRILEIAHEKTIPEIEKILDQKQ